MNNTGFHQYTLYSQASLYVLIISMITSCNCPQATNMPISFKLYSLKCGVGHIFFTNQTPIKNKPASQKLCVITITIK